MNTLFNKVLGENEKCVFYFYLKTEALFGQPNIYVLISEKLQDTLLCKKAIFIFIFIYLFIYLGCIGFSLLRAGFLYLRQVGATLHCGAQASHCGGFSRASQSKGSRALGLQ